jgi:hypothetical protein
MWFPSYRLDRPFRALWLANRDPRALPWATVDRPFGAMCSAFQKKELNSYNKWFNKPSASSAVKLFQFLIGRGRRQRRIRRRVNRGGRGGSRRKPVDEEIPLRSSASSAVNLSPRASTGFIAPKLCSGVYAREALLPMVCLPITTISPLWLTREAAGRDERRSNRVVIVERALIARS